jgi:hypothetical protein
LSTSSEVIARHRTNAQEAFHRLMVRGAALKARSVAVIEQAHRVQAQTRALRAQSGGLVNSRLF